MRPDLDDTSLQWRGDLGVTVFAVGHLAGQTEILLHATVVHDAGFDARSGVVRKDARLPVRRCGGIRVGRLVSLPAGGEAKQRQGHNREKGPASRCHHEAISWPTADSSCSTFRW